MFSRKAVRSCVAVASVIMVWALLLPNSAAAQRTNRSGTRQEPEKKFMLESAGGIALPASRLADVADPGPNVGLQLGYSINRRLALNLLGDVDFLNGADVSAGTQAPDMRLWHYGAGLEANLLRPVAGRSANRWSLRANIGLGATTFNSDRFSAGNAEQDFNHTYFTTGGGLRIGYAVTPRFTTYVGSRAYWMAMDKGDTEALAALNPAKIRPFDSGWTFPVTAGFSWRM